MEYTEVTRLLGYKGFAPDSAIKNLIARCESELLAWASPAHAAREYACNVTRERVDTDAFSFDSLSLAEHLTGCDTLIVFAATLGAQADRLMQRLTHQDISAAAVMQACAAVMLEEYCDDVQEKLAPTRRLSSRFSPGYGDFSLEYQPLLLQLTDAHKRMGLSHTAQHMLTPTKSITAVIGVRCTADATHCGGTTAQTGKQSCVLCGKADCPYKRRSS